MTIMAPTGSAGDGAEAVLTAGLAALSAGSVRYPPGRTPLTPEALTAATLEPRGVIVVVECEHLCMSIRGVRKPGATTVTSAVRGLFRDSASTRAEAMSLILGR